jgi:hypothetical protein
MTRWVQNDIGGPVTRDDPETDDEKKERLLAVFWSDNVFWDADDEFRQRTAAFLALQKERRANGAGDPADAERPYNESGKPVLP